MGHSGDSLAEEGKLLSLVLSEYSKSIKIVTGDRIVEVHSNGIIMNHGRGAFKVLLRKG